MEAESIIKILIKAADHCKKMKQDIKIVPVCINYDRIFDAGYLSEENLKGVFHPGTTLIDVMGKLATFNQDKLGKVFVKFCEPIDVKEYVSKNTPKINE